MRNRKGQNITEFIIISVLIVIGAIAALTLLGGNIKEMLARSNEKVKTYKPFDFDQPGATSTISCTSGVCQLPSGATVIYNNDGTYNLIMDGMEISNIKTDYYKVFQAAGSSGATEMMADYLEMVANNLPGEIEEIDEQVQAVMALATKAREIAQIEEEIRLLALENVEYCNSINEGQGCHTDGNRETITTLVDKLTGTAYENRNDSDPPTLLEEFNALRNDNNEAFVKFVESYPAAAAFVQTLSNEIEGLMHSVMINSYVMYTPQRETGEDAILIWNAKDIYQPGFDDQAKITDLDGEIICQVGQGSYQHNGCN
jgi:Flp pilus assembly pilin Flp